jgi:Uma2 family endonuclease
MATIVQSTSDLLQIVPLHRFSTAHYLELVESGVLNSQDRVELIGGMIVDMSPQGSRHNHVLFNLNQILSPIWSRAIIAVQATLIVAESDVYDPDLMLLRRKPGGYKNQLPVVADVLLLVEAAESSLRRDQQIKLPVYATSGISEYWIADLEREELIVNREPSGGTYMSIEIRRGDDVVSPSAAPELSFAVRQLFD